MRDTFVGDIGDFGKYGLLRAMAGVCPKDGNEELSLAVVWYEVEDRGVKYLNRPERFRSCDQGLFDELQRLVAASTRRISAVEAADLWPKRTQFIRGNPANGDEKQWRNEVESKIEGYDLVFLDPDTGLAPERTLLHCTPDDLQAFWRPGRTLILYQADARKRGHVNKVAAQMT